MDTFMRLIYEHAECQRYHELAVFAVLHEGVLTGLYDDEPASVWAEVASCEHRLDPVLGGYVVKQMAKHVHVSCSYTDAVARVRAHYEGVLDLPPWVSRQWSEFVSPEWYAKHESDWQTAHGVPSLLLCFADTGHIQAFREFMKTLEALLRQQDPDCGFWSLISNSVEGAALARIITRDRYAQHDKAVKALARLQ